MAREDSILFVALKPETLFTVFKLFAQVNLLFVVDVLLVNNQWNGYKTQQLVSFSKAPKTGVGGGVLSIRAPTPQHSNFSRKYTPSLCPQGWGGRGAGGGGYGCEVVNLD